MPPRRKLLLPPNVYFLHYYRCVLGTAEPACWLRMNNCYRSSSTWRRQCLVKNRENVTTWAVGIDIVDFDSIKAASEKSSHQKFLGTGWPSYLRTWNARVLGTIDVSVSILTIPRKSDLIIQMLAPIIIKIRLLVISEVILFKHSIINYSVRHHFIGNNLLQPWPWASALQRASHGSFLGRSRP